MISEEFVYFSITKYLKRIKRITRDLIQKISKKGFALGRGLKKYNQSRQCNSRSEALVTALIGASNVSIDTCTHICTFTLPVESFFLKKIY